VLVEGPTEALALPGLLERVDLDVLRLGIAVVPVGGVGNLARWWRFFRSYGITVFTLFDLDSPDDATGAGRADLAATLSSEPNATVDLDDTSAPIIVRDRYAVFVTNYEAAMRSLFPSQYAELEARGHDRLGPSKTLTARYVVERLSPEVDPGGWAKLSHLAEAILGAARDAPPST
jgi:putative ATP-dependent endonuclease of the OLD family